MKLRTVWFSCASCPAGAGVPKIGNALVPPPPGWTLKTTTKRWGKMRYKDRRWLCPKCSEAAKKCCRRTT